MRIENVTSAQNQKIKELLALQEKSRARKAAGLFVVEGRRELGHCLDAGFVPRTLFICGEILTEEELNDLLGKAERLNPKVGVVQIPYELYGKIAYREGTEGVIAEVEYRERTLDSVKLGDNPLVIVLESVEKPGNLGAVLRSADAAGADAVIICDPLTDLYNPNLVRASIGAVFTLQVAAASSEETIEWLEARNIQILTAQLQDSSLYYDTDMTVPTAIVMGTESTGLTDIWRKAADAHIRIPMLGRLDSLNVSVSAAILLYEALRQRQ
jgi:RNA methyltransferase, TrmH family